MIVRDAQGNAVFGPDGRVKTVRCTIHDLDLQEFSAVDVPAHAGARAAITRSAPILTTTTPKEPATMSTELETARTALTKAEGLVSTLTAEKTALEKARDAEAAKAAYWAKVAALSPVDKAHWGTLGDEAQREFVGKSAAQRAADVAAAEAADPVEVTLSDGTQVRKSAGPAQVGMAKRLKIMEDNQAKTEAELDRTRLTKRAETELGNLGGTLDGKVAVVKALEGKPITDDEKKAAAVVLKSANDGLKAIFRRGGTNDNPGGGVDGDCDPEAKLEAMVQKFATDKKIPLTKAWGDIFVDSEVGPEASRLYDESQAPGNRPSH